MVTAGSVKGPIVGPDLWNVCYDSLFRTDLLEKFVLVGYANNVAALIAAKDIELAQLKPNSMLHTVNAFTVKQRSFSC